MKTYKIPCHWRVYGFYEIAANNLEEALQKAEDSDLPENGEYIEGSFEIDTEMLSFHNKLTKADKKYDYTQS